MEIILYPLLSTRSKRALLRIRKRWGHPYHYSPRYTLVERLMEETGMGKEEVYNQLDRERKFFLDLIDPERVIRNL